MASGPDAGRPIGVGVVGTGFGTSVQIPGFLAVPGLVVVAVVSASPARAGAAAARFGVARAFAAAEFDRFLALEELDLVSIASPPDTHCDYALRALGAGKHVLCEKPTALLAGEARAMLAAARAHGRLALLDHEMRFDPARQRLRELVREGYLGRLHHVQVSFEQDARLDPARPWDWWSDAARGGGILGALGSHVVDAIRFSFAEVEGGCGLLRTTVAERPDPETGRARAVTSDDYAAFWLELAGGATAAGVLSAVSRTPRPGWAMSAHGHEGTLCLEADGTLLGRRRGEERFANLTPPALPIDFASLGLPDSEWARAFVRQAGEIAQALRAGRTQVPLAATFADGLRTQQVLDALRRSSAAGAWIACGPDAADD